MKTTSLFESMRTWRHDFHTHPELGFEEHRTAAKVAELLVEFGLDVVSGIGGTDCHSWIDFRPCGGRGAA